MSRKTIPAKTIVTCDRCKTSDPETFSRGYAHGVYAIMFVDALGVTSGGDSTFDLCAKCALALDEFMRGSDQ